MKNTTHVIILALSLGATAILLPDITHAVGTLATSNFIGRSTCRMSETEMPGFSLPAPHMPSYSSGGGAPLLW
jgi:hypothetical protein